MGTKNNPSLFDCYSLAKPDEPMFTLLARDATAPPLIRTWAIQRAKEIEDGERPLSDNIQVEEALATAGAMETWRAVNRPDGVAGSPCDVWKHPEYLLTPLRQLSRHVFASAASTYLMPPKNWSWSLGEMMSDGQVAAMLTFVRNDLHGRNRAAGWWNDLTTGEPLKRDRRELAMLIVTELAESMEGFRKGRLDDHLPHRPMLEVELADAAIRIFDTAGGLGWPLVVGFKVPREALPHSGVIVVPAALLVICQSVSSLALVDGVEPLSEALAMVLFVGEALGLDVPGAIVEKVAYNAQRADHKREARLADGGKKL